MVVLFDGVCNLCDRTVRFVLEHDRSGRIRFAPLQSTYARVLLKQHGYELRDPPESILVYDGGLLHAGSSGAVRIARALPFPWKLLAVFWIVPRPFRDWVYRFVARNRYRWFGRQDTCALPDPRWKSRFIESE